ncbi:unnamed protein product [Strongylus vulgaris]|uniref:Uncharacterized protein n=1 Tax=Strongylus vulgaris TaxID=40348 RepID=A0A3P7LH26_STRVU|nr:unnamed protein product [Strongylus vulgaris]
MFRFCLLTIAIYYAYAHCSAQQQGSDGVLAPCPQSEVQQSPVVYDAPPPPPPQYPLIPPNPPLRERRRNRHSSSATRSNSESRERRSYDSRSKRRGHRRYINHGMCEKAIVTCLQHGVTATPDFQILSFGLAVDNVLKCNRRGRWIAMNSEHQMIEVSSVACYAPLQNDQQLKVQTASFVHLKAEQPVIC